MDRSDVAVVGAGIGGLTCSALLAKRGLKVVLFEKGKKPGGYCTSFSRDGFLFDSCIDSIGCVTKDGIIREALEGLRVFEKVDLIELNPIRRNIFPGLTVDLPHDDKLYKERLKELFPGESEGIGQVFSILNNIYRWSNEAVFSDTVNFDLQFWVNRSYKELLDDHIDDRRLQGVLSSYCNFLGLPASKVSAIAAANILMHYLKGGAYRVGGGIQNLANAFLEEIRENGGTVFFEEEVDEISCGNTGVVVKTRKGRELQVNKVISGMDLKTMVNSILRTSAIAKSSIQTVNKLENSGSFIILYLGLNRGLTDSRLTSSMGYFSSFDPEAMLNENEEVSFGISFPSLVDKTVAREGTDSVVVHWPFCGPRHSPEKNDVYSKVIAILNEFVPEIEKCIVYKGAADQETFINYTGNTNGAAYGWVQSVDLFASLPTLRSLMKDFYTVGHWAGYGGGIMPSILSGVRVARQIGKEWRAIYG